MPSPSRLIKANSVSISTSLDLQILAKRLVETHGELHKPTVGKPILQLEFLALNEIIGILVDVRDLRNAPVISAAVFDLGLALLNVSFLDLKLCEAGLRAYQCQPRRRDGETHHVL